MPVLAGLLLTPPAQAQGLGGLLKKAGRVLSGTAGQEPRGIGCDQVNGYELGTRVEGTWTVSDCQTVEGGITSAIDVYAFRVEEQRDVVVVLEAPGMHMNLAILNDEGVPLARQAVSGDDAELVTQLAPGTYAIRAAVSQLGDRRTGRYTLTTTTDQVGFRGCLTLPTLPTDTVLQGTWSVSDCSHRPLNVKNYVDYYTFAVSGEKDVTLMLEAPGMKSTLTLLTRDGVEVADADGYPQTPARLEAQLAPGVYVAAAGVAAFGGPGERKTGRYTLTLREGS